MNRNVLKFDVSIRPLSPVHIGIGNEFVSRGGYHLYHDGRTEQLALLQTRKLAGRMLDQFGDQGNIAVTVQQRMEQDDYPPAIARDIESGLLATRRMSVHPGALTFLRANDRNGGLKTITAQANGLPYIPGSSVKGALRTAWLDWQTQQPGAYPRFLSAVRNTKITRENAKEADDTLIRQVQVADSLSGLLRPLSTDKSTAPNRDLFRAVQVSDLLPDRTQNLTRVQAVLSMSYQVGSHVRPSDSGKAGAQAWECLNPNAGATYIGTVTVDLDLLKRMSTTDADARNLAEGLASAQIWSMALSGYGSRLYTTEKQHYDILRRLENQFRKGIKIREQGGGDLLHNWIEKLSSSSSKFMPIGMGTGLMAHTILGAFNPDFDSESGDSIEYFGDEYDSGGLKTLTEQALLLGKKTNGYEYQPAPKSRRVTVEFLNPEATRQDPVEMRAERPLGWTALTLTPRQDRD